MTSRCPDASGSNSGGGRLTLTPVASLLTMVPLASATAELLPSVLSNYRAGRRSGVRTPHPPQVQRYR